MQAMEANLEQVTPEAGYTVCVPKNVPLASRGISDGDRYPRYAMWSMPTAAARRGCARPRRPAPRRRGRD